MHHARRSFLAELFPSYALTLSFNDWPVHMDRIRSVLKHLHAAVDRRLFGTRYPLLPADQRTAFAAVVELPDAHPHMHMAWRVPADRSEEFEHLFAGRKPIIWTHLAPAGTAALEPITKARGWTAYLSKHLPSDDAAGLLFLSSEHLPT
ncbi:MAG: hypothetical protein ACRYGG_01855 [Janthinobacterium lividum]